MKRTLILDVSGRKNVHIHFWEDGNLHIGYEDGPRVVLTPEQADELVVAIKHLWHARED